MSLQGGRIEADNKDAEGANQLWWFGHLMSQVLPSGDPGLGEAVLPTWEHHRIPYKTLKNIAGKEAVWSILLNLAIQHSFRYAEEIKAQSSRKQAEKSKCVWFMCK